MKRRETPLETPPDRTPYYRIELSLAIDGIEAITLVRRPDARQRQAIAPWRNGLLERVRTLGDVPAHDYDDIWRMVEQAHELLISMWADPVLDPPALDDWFQAGLFELDVVMLGFTAALHWLAAYAVPGGLQERVNFTPGGTATWTSSPSV